MKTAPLLRRKVSKYTSKCDQGNLTVVVCVIRISLCNRDRRFSGELAKQGWVMQADRPYGRFHLGSIIQCTAVNSLIPIRVWAGTKNFCSVAFLRWEQYQNSVDDQHNFPHKHHHHGVPFAPPMGWDLWIRPIRHRKPLLQGSIEGAVAWFYIK